MDDKYQNKYRIASARWQQWDYGWDAAYFITICTKDRKHHFGEITEGRMELSSTGILTDVFWHEIKNHAQHIGLGAFVVMPNHIHGILVLDGNALTLPPTPPINETPGQRRFQNQGKNTISSIVGGYKSAVTKHANRMELEMSWQTRFHDHVIRDEPSFVRITEYIKNNPQNWKDDRFFDG
ncbi:MAG: transposase [Bacteroidetes bacterium]|nr:transposase [Bacteroidota bacterium]